MAEVAQKARDNVIDEINLTVQKTKVTVDSIAKQLHKITLQKVATELVGFRTNSNMKFEKTPAFEKGSADMWEEFTTWLTSLDRTMVLPSLSLTLNTVHQYKSGLLLAYLLSSEATP